MRANQLTDKEKQVLLRLARQALEQGVQGEKIEPLDLDTVTPRLRENGASFVTLTKNGNLRGCIGTLNSYQPLAEDVREHAVAAALEDYRFPNVQPDELPGIVIEISCLTEPFPLEYGEPQDLPSRLRPGIDGVVLRDGSRRATFLPQVWEKLSDPEDFLSNLCYKMGVETDLWQKKRLDVLIYQVEEFHE
jgi:AmmeMemoRadiSam system protein A